MFQTIAKRLHDTPPVLGMGLYYFRPDDESYVRSGDWTKVELKAPLILNGKQASLLIRKYETDSADPVTATTGAWTLRREVLHMGRDGIIARCGIAPVGARLNDGGMTIVDLVVRAVETEGIQDEWRMRAQTCRLRRGKSPQDVNNEWRLITDDEALSRAFLSTTTAIPTFPSHPYVGR